MKQNALVTYLKYIAEHQKLTTRAKFLIIYLVLKGENYPIRQYVLMKELHGQIGSVSLKKAFQEALTFGAIIYRDLSNLHPQDRVRYELSFWKKGTNNDIYT